MKHVYNKAQCEAGIDLLLKGLGVDLEDDNFTETPARVARAFRELCSGLYIETDDIAKIFGKTFDSPYKGIIQVGPVIAHGVCPHHLLPVEIEAVLAYLPRDKKLGLSKLARAIKMFAARPAMQETVSHDLVEAFVKYVDPLGVALYMNGKHNCMTCRGILQTQSTAITLDVRGLFETDPGVKTEFQRLLSQQLRK